MTQLYLIASIPQAGPASALADGVAAAGAASVTLHAAAGNELTAPMVLPYITAIQQSGAAVLLCDAPHLARTVKADGVHLTWRPDIVAVYEEARSILGRGAIVGVDAGASRHDAMMLGEAGADYIAFAAAAGSDQQYELVAWWAEIFEIPVVAFDVTSPATAQRCAMAGAEFVAVPYDVFAVHSDDFARALAVTPATSVA